jgi:hypothetical protein
MDLSREDKALLIVSIETLVNADKIRITHNGRRDNKTYEDLYDLLGRLKKSLKDDF